MAIGHYLRLPHHGAKLSFPIAALLADKRAGPYGRVSRGLVLDFAKEQAQRTLSRVAGLGRSAEKVL
jgi:hypothetical protein